MEPRGKGPKYGGMVHVGFLIVATRQLPVRKPETMGTSYLETLDPRNSKYPISNNSGSKNHTTNGFWDQGPEILGTWTLWESFVRLEIIDGART